MDLFYENQVGIIHFKGSGKRGEGFFIKSVSGLGPIEKEHTTLSYANLPGQTLIGERERERVVTVSADVCSQNNVKKLYSHLVDVLYNPGKLKVFSGGQFRKIDCRCSLFAEPERQGKGIMSIRIQLTCDQPYFTDEETQQVTVFSRNDLVQNTFTLPCIFTERTTGVVMVNQGRVPAEPVFSVYNIGLGEGVTEPLEDYGILFKNERTGQMLKLLCYTEPGEKITINIPERKVESSLKGNLLSCLSPESYLSNFYLEPGENRIEVLNLNQGEEINVLMHYENHYIEAVM